MSGLILLTKSGCLTAIIRKKKPVVKSSEVADTLQDSCHFRAFCEETSQNAKKLGFFKIFCTYGVQHRAGYRKRDDVAHFHPEINCHVPMMWRFQAPRPRPPSPRPRPSQKGSRSKEVKGHAGPYAPQSSSINSFRFSFFSFIQA